MKYVLIFGGIGIAILMFVFMGKKFDPIKKIKDWFAGKIGGGIVGSLGKTISSAFGIGKIGGVPIDKISSAIQSTGTTGATKRRIFSRMSKEASRKLGVLAKNKAVSADIRKRASIMKTTFRSVSKKKRKNISKSFSNIFKRKKSRRKKKKKTKRRLK